MVAFKARRLVCSAIVVMSFEHVADALGRLREFADARIGLLGLVHRLFRDCGRLGHLAADLVTTMSIAPSPMPPTGRWRGFIRGRRNGRREPLGHLGGAGQRARGGFQLRRGGGDGVDDFAEG